VVFRSLFSRPSVAEVTPQQAHSRQASGAVIVDVREPDEWRAGHIPGAVHIPLGQLGRQLHRLDRESDLIMVCRSGNRSAAATQALSQAGYSRVSNLAGGMIAWGRHRLPVER
jgi:rhodanese-related sulfurtransferase